ncbi:alcohol dehydrogenase catalytic domain-containing protein, partial [Vibrio parahaemolyticus]
GLGFEAAGVVETLGDGVTDLKVGDRVAYVNAGVGAYSTVRNVPAEKLVPIPASVSDDQAAAIIFKGLTAQYLVRKTHKVEPGDL